MAILTRYSYGGWPVNRLVVATVVNAERAFVLNFALRFLSRHFAAQTVLADRTVFNSEVASTYSCCGHNLGLRSLGRQFRTSQSRSAV